MTRRAGLVLLRKAGPWGLALLLLSLPALALACPTCSNALGANPETLGFARGIYLSIIAMLGTLFSMIAFFIYKLVRMARREDEQAPGPLPNPRA